MADSTTLGLLFEIAADPSRAIAATEDLRSQAGSAFAELEAQMTKTVTNSLGITKEFAVGMGVATGAVIGLGAAMFELANKASEVGAKIYEASERTGLSAETLSGMNAVAKTTGGNFESLSLSISRATVNLQKIIDAGPAAHNVLSQIMGGAQGLADLGLKPVDERMQEVLKRIFAMNDVGERNRALQELMGRGWMQNVESLKILAEQGFGPAIEKAKELGIYFDDVGARRAKEFENNLKTLEARVQSFAMSLGNALLPAINSVMFVLAHGTEIVHSINAEMASGKSFNEAYADAFKKVATEAQSANTELQQTATWFQQISEEAHQDKGLKGLLHDLFAAQFEEEKKAYDKELELEREQARKEGEYIRQRAAAYDEMLKQAVRDYDAELKIKDAATRASSDFEISEGERALRAYGEFMTKHNAGTLRELEEWEKNLRVSMEKQSKLINDAYRADEAGNREQYRRKIESHAEYLQRERAALDQWYQMQVDTVGRSEALDEEYARRKAELAAQSWAIDNKYYEGAVGLLENLSQAHIKSHALQVALMLERAAMRVIEETGDALSALAFGNGWAAAMHFASAAEFAVMGGVNAFSSGGGGGGGGAAGGRYGSGKYGGPSNSPGGLPPAVAAGATPSGTYHVLVMGETDGANTIAQMLTNAVRFNGAQLTSTQVVGQ